MSTLERGAQFLDLAFDWFLLEKWDDTSADPPSKQHFLLGQAYASLGHLGRRPYFQAADNPGTPLPRPLASVPHSLLTPSERIMNAALLPIWLRTCYGPGTDARHAALLDATGGNEDEFSMELGGSNRVLDDADRYSLSHWSKVYAFAPVLLEDFNSLYGDRGVEWDDPDLQARFFWMREPPGETGEGRMERESRGQRDFFVVDEEAMRTGWVLWLFVDEYGKVVQEERIRPGWLATVAGRRGMGMGLTELTAGIARTPGPEEDGLGQWTAPA